MNDMQHYLKKFPALEVDLDAIRENARLITSRCAAVGVAVAGVTKGVCGAPPVARAMLEGGVRQLADSRLENLARLRNSGIRAELMLLRLPMPSETAKTVRIADISLNSELPVIRLLAEEASKTSRIHKVILMVELGDLREGVDPEDVLPMAARIAGMSGVKLAGIGANLTCYGGVVPSEENLGVLADLAGRIEKDLGCPMEIVSGGNTSSLALLSTGRMPPQINHLRLGESLLLGMNTLDRSPIPGARQDAFLLKAEVIEVRTKHSVPLGEIAQDAFGAKPDFKDRGSRRRAILAIGREDIAIDGLTPMDEGVELMGASSDHMLADVEHSEQVWMSGDIMSFRPGYSALLAAMTSEYVAKRYFVKPSYSSPPAREIAIIGAPSGLGSSHAGCEYAPLAVRRAGIVASLKSAGWNVHDMGDLEVPAPASKSENMPINLKEVVAFNNTLADAVEHRLAEGRSPLIIGGDHSISIGVLAGVRRARPRLAAVFFDAHADFNTEQTSPSQNIHGMVISACVGLGHRGLVECGGGVGLDPESLAIIGLRDIDYGEREALKQSRAMAFTMEDIDYLGIREVIEIVLDRFAKRVDGIHVSFDMDVLDPASAPAVSVPVPGGISAREAFLALEIISRSGVPLSMDIVELNPARDRDAVTANLAAGLGAALFGKRILGNNGRSGRD